MSSTEISRDFQGLRILVVDDTRENRVLLQHQLEEMGSVVVTSSDGDKAVVEAGNAPFDIILMDIQMPQLNGYEAAKRIRDHGFQGKLFAFSALKNEEEKELWETAGFDDFFNKPFTGDIAQKILGHLNGQQPDENGAATSSPPDILLDVERVKAATPNIVAIIDKFCMKLIPDLHELEEDCLKADVTAALGLTHRIRGAAGSCGFKRLAESLMKLEDMIDAKASLEDQKQQLENIKNISILSRQQFLLLTNRPSLEQP